MAKYFNLLIHSRIYHIIILNLVRNILHSSVVNDLISY